MDLYDQLVRKLYLEAKAKQAAEIEQKRQAEIEAAKASPAERLYKAVSPGNLDKVRQARDREPEPEKAHEKESTKEAERMAPRPAGMHLQGPPSPAGGVRYVNTRVWKPENTEPSQREDLHDQVQRRRSETTAATSSKESERQQLETIERQLRDYQSSRDR